MDPSVHHHHHHVDAEVLDTTNSDIAAFYAGRSVLVTGASGFMGKVLLEKLLRACPALGAVYVLVRSKKGLGAQDRLRPLLAAPVFDALRRQRPCALEKVKAVAGDVALPGLGLSPADRALLEDTVSVVFHLAATVRFDEHLRKAAVVNVAGTEAVLDLCRGMPRLAALVHVSTAYCACTRREVGEEVYPPPMSASSLRRELEVRDDAAVASDTARLIGGYPNTYTFTKAIAETVVLEKGEGLPIVIFRPSIVSPSLSEPMAGWVDNWNGPVGPWVSIGKGTLSCVFGRAEAVSDLVPVDVCINVMVAAAWDAHAYRGPDSPGVTVYNCVSSASNPVTWGAATNLWLESVRRRPFASSAGTPRVCFTTNRVVHNARTLAGQVIPAHVVDALALLTAGKSPRLASLIWKQCARMQSLEPFTTTDFAFKADNARRLWERMSATDRRLYPYADLAVMDWGRYMEAVLEGTKHYLLHEAAASGASGDSTSSARATTLRAYNIERLLPYLLSVPVLAASAKLLAKPRSKL